MSYDYDDDIERQLAEDMERADREDIFESESDLLMDIMNEVYGR